MLTLSICKIWVTCVMGIDPHFLYFSLYSKIFHDICWKDNKGCPEDSPGGAEPFPGLGATLSHSPSRKSVFSLTEVGQMNGSVAGGGGVAAGGGAGGGGGSGGGVSGSGGSSGNDKEMPAVHEVGEELIWTGRCPPQA